MKYPKEMQKRIGNGMGCGVDIGDGWVSLVIELDEKLAKLHPDYTIDQIKEKFGTLRYYVTGVDSEEGYQLIANAEASSAKICEYCGKEGCTVNNSGWLKTLCKEHSGV